MKSTLKFTIAALVVLSTAALLSAAPRSKSQPPPPHRVKSFGTNLVCSQCQPTTADSDAMKACIVGGKLTCQSCNTGSKLTAHGRPANRPGGRELVYVNENGVECVFVASGTARP